LQIVADMSKEHNTKIGNLLHLVMPRNKKNYSDDEISFLTNKNWRTLEKKKVRKNKNNSFLSRLINKISLYR